LEDFLGVSLDSFSASDNFKTLKISFYLDDKEFQHKMIPLDAVKALMTMEWRITRQGFDYGRVAKGSKEDTKNVEVLFFGRNIFVVSPVKSLLT